MNIAASAVIEPLGEHHDRAVFACGNGELDEYLKRRANQDAKRNITRVFVLAGEESNVIAGFYTVSTTGIPMGELPEEQARKLPRYPMIPAVLIGRLAVGVEHQGQGLGGVLLIDAFRRIVQAGGDIASYAVVVDAKDENAAEFYRKYGFIGFPTIANRLFLPIDTIKKLAL